MKASVADRMIASAVESYRSVCRAFLKDQLGTDFVGSRVVERVRWGLVVPDASHHVTKARDGKTVPALDWVCDIAVVQRSRQDGFANSDTWREVSPECWSTTAALAVQYLVHEVAEWRTGARGWPNSSELEKALERMRDARL